MRRILTVVDYEDIELRLMATGKPLAMAMSEMRKKVYAMKIIEPFLSSKPAPHHAHLIERHIRKTRRPRR